MGWDEIGYQGMGRDEFSEISGIRDGTGMSLENWNGTGMRN